VRRLGDGVWELESAGSTSHVYLVEAEERVLVDAGVKRRAARIATELRAAGAVPRLLLVTHGDPDHVGSCDYLRRELGLAVCAPEADRATIDWALPDRGLAPRLFRALTGPRRPVRVDRWLAGGETVAGLQAVPTPGHTPGHTTFRLATTLVAGDAFVTGERFRESPMSRDREEARRSIERLAELDLDLAVSGHGKPAHGRSRSSRLEALAASWRR
jgi:glyoxylase-like metal-dependent hydrolase (beta-lactamase superfamily II)